MMIIREFAFRILFLFSLLWWGSCFCQPQDYQVNTERKISFTSPNAASLGKYGFIPVDFSTGLSTISIPIWEIKENDISLPINLSYNNNGLRVSEEASWVGLGWSLVAGGSITRVIRGVSDLEGSAQLNNNNGKHYDDLNNPLSIDNLTANRIVEQYYDGEPDLYSFSAGGYSGKFILSHGEVVPISYNGLKFEKVGENFKMTDTQGTVFVFSKKEMSSSNSASVAFNLPYYVSAWLLTSITSANGADQIEFIYANTPETINSGSSYGLQHVFSGNPGPYSSGSPCGDMRTNKSNSALSSVTSWRLERIQSRSTEIVFTPESTDRLDLFGNARALGEITVKERYTNSPVKKYKFKTSYFGDTANKLTARLRLDNVTELDPLGNPVRIEPHYFEYYDNPSVSKTSYSMDHWGYYNASGNTTLVPHLYDWQNFGNANREPFISAARGGLLKKIIYPTKGHSEFQYEQNEQTLNGNKIPGPGLRVSQISHFDGRNTVYKTYLYDDPISIGIPSYSSQYTYKTCICVNGSGTGCVPDFYDCQVYSVTGDNTSLYGSLSGFGLAYRKVVEKEGLNAELGSTEYFYEASPNFEFDRDMRLREVVVKNSAGVPLSKKVNSYTTIEDSRFRAFRPYLTTSYNICPANAEIYQTDPSYGYFLNEYEFEVMYFIIGTWKFLNKTIETSYVNGSPGLVKETKYNYNSTANHRFVTSIETDQSDGGKEILWWKYVEDYVLVSPPSEDAFYKGLLKMKELNIRERVIESQRRSVDVNHVERVIDGRMMLYRSFETDNNVQLGEIYKLQEVNDLLFSESYILNSQIKFNHLPYKKEVTYNYNTLGRLVEKKTDALLNSYLWGYNNTLPIASCTGVSYSDLNSYFSQVNGDMQQLHNHPSMVGKLLTSYQYRPLIGISSITDQNGFRSSFDYDDFGRLKMILDHNNHIQRAFQYNYKFVLY